MAIMADNRKFYIPWDAADLIVIENLREQYEFLVKENEEIEALDDIPDYKAEDLGYNIKVLKALRTVLKHYGADV